MKNIKAISISILLALFLFGCIGATEAKEMPDSESDPFIDLMLNQTAFMEGRYLSLAEAIPADKYSWKPNSEVRTTSEQFVHLLSSLYFFPGLMGADKPDFVTRDLEKTLTDKKEIIEKLKSAFTAAADFLKNYDTSMYEEMVKTPFGEYNQRTMLLILNNHMHEHLGQLIVYARSNGIVPPWSQKEEDN